jgi:hypothetical protein
MGDGTFTRGDALWLIGEIHKANVEIEAGNKDRYVAGRRVALASAAGRLLRISREDLHRYMMWVSERVESGERIGSLEEPAGWIRKNPA